ncbi:putative hydroxypyruvate isomerase [Eurytemora carolleeae]|uniref:putative hydroxypyruvate isomerase n=1 Tax=Eurytemora carolleeae TaxID=1294199 RepID=UPI000C792F6D|nr:putative hydroxypyruvate isomerase [Eurytemora carolleeae]|eukprot:XP_023330504.1 putative hydroxypyruvate isomerase [Eurytemora affinis]
MKFCANLSFMYGEEENLLRRYDLAEKSGFKGVECAFPYSVPVEELKLKLMSTGLTQVLINTDPGTVYGYTGRKGEEDQFMESLNLSLKYCRELGVKLLHIMSGIKQDGVSKEEVKGLMLSNLRKAIPILEREGVIGLLEPINPFSLPGYNMDSFNQAVDIIRELNHSNIRLQLDIFHLQQVDGNITRRITELLPLVSHIQIAQVPLRGEPNSSGELDYKYILKLLENQRYQGWIGLEYKPVSNTQDGLRWIQDFGYNLLCI